MKRRTKWIAAGAVLAAAAAGTGGVAIADKGADRDESISGDALERASAAALEHTGGGRVTETEVGDEESYYEVEVTLPDGSQVDVQLDEEFRVVGEKADKDEPNDED